MNLGIETINDELVMLLRFRDGVTLVIDKGNGDYPKRNGERMKKPMSCPKIRQGRK